MVVAQEFEKVGLKPGIVSMGEVELAEEPTNEQLEDVEKRLNDLGFEILDNQRQKLIERIKNLIVNKVQGGAIEEHFSIIEFLKKSVQKDYSQVSRLFSEVEGITLEQFFILQKIEKVKEWLVYDELTLSEIAWKLGYSSVAHLSSQFKKVTGLTPSYFKNLGGKQRKSLDQI